MRRTDHILSALKAAGGRMTRVRVAAVAAFARRGEPMTAQELGAALARRGLKVNKTTLYREIEFLKGRGAIVEILFGDRSARYELMDDGHHHHVVCAKCDRVVDVELDRDLEAHEKAIEKKTGFSVLRHSLEFFGLCPRCKRAR